MSILSNPRHERFARLVVSGESATKAYVLAGYKKSGASANASRLLRNEVVSSRVAELGAKIEAAFIELRITEREERLKAKQWLWDLVREAVFARGAGDYERMMKTGIVTYRERAVGTRQKQRIVQEYEIDSGTVDALLNIERNAAIECGQWSEKSEVEVKGKMNLRAQTLAATFSLQELEAMKARMLAVADQHTKIPVVTLLPASAEAEQPESASKNIVQPDHPNTTPPRSWHD